MTLGEGEAGALLLGLAGALLLLLGVAEMLVLGLADALLPGVADALPVATGVAAAPLAAPAVAVVMAVVLADAESSVLAVLALAGEKEAASRTNAERLAGTERAAEVAAGGWPHPLGATAVTAVTPAAVLPPRRPPAMPEETMAAPAATPSTEKADQADFMTAPSPPWHLRRELTCPFTIEFIRTQEPFPRCGDPTPPGRAPPRPPRPQVSTAGALRGTTPCGNLPSPSCAGRPHQHP